MQYMKIVKKRRNRSGSSFKKFSNGKSSKTSGKSHGVFRGGRRGSNRNKRKIPTFDPSQFINTNPIDVIEEVFIPKNSFDTLDIDRRIAQRLTELKIISPTPIQDQTIPEILKGRDIVGLAETGTGKTAAFLIPLIQKTLLDNNHLTLILAPTRELAIQINEEMRSLTKGLRIFSTICVGGVNIGPQISSLRYTNHFIIGTPGRVIDLINRKSILPHEMNVVVLDEADRMLDMGFINDMKAILSATPKHRQTLFFSATMSEVTNRLVHDFLNNPVEVSVKKKDIANSIEQDVVYYKDGSKFDTLINLIKGSTFRRVIIFGAMKHSVERLSKDLIKSGVKTVSIHGNKNHGRRQRALQTFKDGDARVMVATDVAARGIHVDNVTHVINYDLPQTFNDYVHRIGRTGRVLQRGKALTFIKSGKRY